MLQRNFKPTTLNAFRPLVLGATIGLLLAPGGARLLAGSEPCSTPVASQDAVRGSGNELVVLEYSHKNGTWKLRQWTNSCGKLKPTKKIDEPEILVGNKAKIRLRKEDMANFRVFLTETNPLLYAFAQTAASESPTADIQDLQAFLSILGGTLGAAVGTGGFDLNVATVAGPEKGAAGPPEELIDAVKAINGFIEKVTVNLQSQAHKMSKLSSKRDALAANADTLVEARTKIRLAVQQIELGDAAGDIQDISEIVPKGILHGTAAAISNFRKAKDDIQPQCSGPMALLVEAIDLILLPTPEKSLASANASFNEKLTFLQSGNPSNCNTDLNDAIQSLATQIETQSLGPTTEGLSHQDAKAWTTCRSAARLFLETEGTAKKALDDAEKVLSATSTMENTAMQLAAFWTKLKEITPNGNDGQQCNLRNGVIELSRGNPQWKWNTVYNEEAKISLVQDELLKGVVPTRPTDLTVKYEIHPYRRTEFSLSFGLIYTEIVDPSWSAVTNPLDSATKAIARTDEASRAGQPTLLLTLHPFRLKEKRFSPGLDIGAGYSSGSAGAFLGLSVGLTDYLRLGAGWTWQEVSRLDHSQSELRYLDDGGVDPTSLTIVSGNDDILKRSHFDDNYYISLVFNFSGLQLFKPKE